MTDQGDPPLDELDGTTSIVSVDEAEKWPTLAEASKMAEVSVQTLRRYVKNGRIEGRMVRGEYRCNPEDLANLKKHATEVTHSAVLDHMVDSTAILSAMAKGQMAHSEKLVNAVVRSLDPVQKAYEAQNAVLLQANKNLAEENKELRAELKDYWAQQKIDKLEEKKLEIKKENSKKGWELASQGLPQIFSLISAKLTPTDPTATDKGIALWLQGVSEEQAKKLHAAGCLTDAQVFEAVSIRASGKALPGQLSTWLRSFSNEQLQKMLASGILSKEQCIGLMSYHEAASKLSLPAAAGALAMGAASSTPAPAPSSPSSPAPTPANDTAAGKVSLSLDEADALASLLQAIFECDDETIGLIFSKLDKDKINKIKGIKWTP